MAVVDEEEDAEIETVDVEVDVPEESEDSSEMTASEDETSWISWFVSRKCMGVNV